MPFDHNHIKEGNPAIAFAYRLCSSLLFSSSCIIKCTVANSSSVFQTLCIQIWKLLPLGWHHFHIEWDSSTKKGRISITKLPMPLMIQILKFSIHISKKNAPVSIGKLKPTISQISIAIKQFKRLDLKNKKKKNQKAKNIEMNTHRSSHYNPQSFCLVRRFTARRIRLKCQLPGPPPL